MWPNAQRFALHLHPSTTKDLARLAKHQAKQVRRNAWGGWGGIRSHLHIDSAILGTSLEPPMIAELLLNATHLSAVRGDDAYTNFPADATSTAAAFSFETKSRRSAPLSKTERH